ncbi:MAG: hypothetical protein JNL82_36350 [Myxococcales bacterium]|nr:hypothetical protein [Myxococcales bacterium]
MNFPSAREGEDSEIEFDVLLEDGTEEESESPAKRASEVLVVIPRGLGFRVDEESIPQAICVRIPVGVRR